MVPARDLVLEIPGYLYPGEGRRFRAMAAELPRGGLVVEIGVMAGLSTCYWAQGAAEAGARVVAIDPFDVDLDGQRRHYEASASAEDGFTRNIDLGRKYSQAEVEANLARYGVRGVVELVAGYSDEVVGSWQRPIDLLFLDGDHNYRAVERDFTAWCAHLRPGGRVVVHDANLGSGFLRPGFAGPSRLVRERLAQSSAWSGLERFGSTATAVKVGG